MSDQPRRPLVRLLLLEGNRWLDEDQRAERVLIERGVLVEPVLPRRLALVIERERVVHDDPEDDGKRPPCLAEAGDEQECASTFNHESIRPFRDAVALGPERDRGEVRECT